MSKKLTKAIIITISLFLSGVYLIYVGFFEGNDMAISISRPAGASGWTTSQELITGCTYFPIVIGVSLLILSMIFFTVLFSYWIKKFN